MGEVPALEDCRVGNNLLEALEGPFSELVKLHTLDASKNKLATAKPLEALRRLPRLRNLDIAGNPFIDGEDVDPDVNTRVEALLCHWRLDNIDGTPVTAEERLE